MFSLTFVYSPPSNTYGYEFVELIPNGAHIVSELRVRVGQRCVEPVPGLRPGPKSLVSDIPSVDTSCNGSFVFNVLYNNKQKTKNWHKYLDATCVSFFLRM
jgi:hypothetical protein